VSGIVLLAAVLPLMAMQVFPPGRWVATLPWRSVEAVVQRVHSANRYALFARVPERRYELSLQGSRDGRQWVEYRMNLKPTDPRSLPPVSVLHLPRLDDQLVRLATRVGRDPNARPPNWLQRLSRGLLTGHPLFTGLFPVNPFPDAPPAYIRWVVYEYRFADPVTKRERGVWWVREPVGRYGPVFKRR
jgi:hypothetical protein